MEKTAAIKEIEKTETLVRMLKNTYNAALDDKENIKPNDINAVFDLIIERLLNLKTNI